MWPPGAAISARRVVQLTIKASSKAIVSKRILKTPTKRILTLFLASKRNLNARIHGLLGCVKTDAEFEHALAVLWQAAPSQERLRCYRVKKLGAFHAENQFNGFVALRARSGIQTNDDLTLRKRAGGQHLAA
jgi:hypothetical protein